MTEALLELLPDSPVYHVGMYRNPGSNIPVQYYNRLPKGHPSDVALILDPIIASCENAARTTYWQDIFLTRARVVKLGDRFAVQEQHV